jgi:hypothetical protein
LVLSFLFSFSAALPSAISVDGELIHPWLEIEVSIWWARSCWSLVSLTNSILVLVSRCWKLLFLFLLKRLEFQIIFRKCENELHDEFEFFFEKVSLQSWSCRALSGDTFSFVNVHFYIFISFLYLRRLQLERLSLFLFLFIGFFVVDDHLDDAQDFAQVFVLADVVLDEIHIQGNLNYMLYFLNNQNQLLLLLFGASIQNGIACVPFKLSQLLELLLEEGSEA